MEQYLINDTTLTAIGDVIRQLKGEEKYYKSSTVIHSSNVDDEGKYITYKYSERSALEVITLPGATNLHVHMKYMLGTTYPSLNFMCVWEGAHPEYTAEDNYDTSLTGKVYNTSGYTIQYKEFDVPGDTLTFGMCNDYGTVDGQYFITITSDKGGRIEEHFYLPSEIPQQILDIAPVVESITLTANGTYTPGEGVDGFNEVKVDVEGTLPEEALIITGSCNYKFASNGWNWFVERYGNQITTNNIMDISNLFYNSNTLTTAPFDINIHNTCKSMSYSFYNASKLKEVPLIKGELTSPTGNYSGTLSMNNMFYGCSYLRNIPYDYFHNFGGDAFWEASKKYMGGRCRVFENCHSLRQLPDIRMLPSRETAYYNDLYYYTFRLCYALDEITNMPVKTTNAITSNFFADTFYGTGRIKNMTFETNEDGTPKIAEWKSQTIQLLPNVGYRYYGDIVNHNSGITRDKEVSDDATYQALKNDPDWFTGNVAYSRYNHDSAVATINSLPDTSAYLTANGGTNTIKFEGKAGEKTDGGAIGNLTAEEIAVAAAKGWTVTLT